MGRIRLNGLDALPTTWPWRATHLRPLARSGNQRQPALNLAVSRSLGLTSLPICRQAGSGGPGRCLSVPGCPSASGPWCYRTPKIRSALGRLAVGDRHLILAPPNGMPGRGRPGTTPRESAPCPFGCCASALGRLRVPRPSARHLRSSCQCLRSPDGNAIGLGGLQVAHTVASFGWASYEALGSSPESCRWGHTEDWRRVRVVLRDFLIFRRDVYAIATPS